MRPFVAARTAVIFLAVVMVVYYHFGLDRFQDVEPAIDSDLTATVDAAKGAHKISGAEILPSKPRLDLASAVVQEALQSQTSVEPQEDETSDQLAKEIANNAARIDPVAVVDSQSLQEVKEAAQPIVTSTQFANENLPKQLDGIHLKDPEPEALITDEELEIMTGPITRYPPPDRPHVTLTGFKTCEILEGATFFTDLELELPGVIAPLDANNADILVKYIEDTVEQMLLHPELRHDNIQRMTKVTSDLNIDFLKRGVCWNVAQGNLQWWKPYVRFGSNLKDKFSGRVLRTINSEAAFPFLNFDGNLGIPNSLHITSKPSYKLAYVLMVHADSENIAALIDALADPTVFIYIHVDVFAPDSFHQKINKLVKGRPDIAVMPRPLAVTWSHVSLVWVEVRAFFDLLDLIRFEYVINLSGMDYPLKSAKTIYEHLNKKPGSNWIWWSTEDKNMWQLDYRVHNMFHCREHRFEWASRCVFSPEPHGWREFDGFKDLFPRLYKTSQWMILHHSAVSYLRKSEAAKLLLMHSEHASIPDEMFFSTFYAASPFGGRTYRDPKRLMYWDGGSHPYEWTSNDEAVVRAWAYHFLWMRKVDVVGDPKLKEILDDIRAKDVMSSRIVLHYEGGIIPVD